MVLDNTYYRGKHARNLKIHDFAKKKIKSIGSSFFYVSGRLAGVEI